MQVINELIKDLTEISQEFNDGTIDLDERNIKLDLLINQIESVQLNFNYQPMYDIDKRIKASFNQLLFRTKFKAIASIQSLKVTNSKQVYNRQARFILKKRLFFPHLHSTIRKNCEAWIRRNELQYYNLNKPTFILGGNDNE